MTPPSTLYSYSCLQSCNLDPERGVADRLGCSSTDLGSGDASCLQQPLPDEDAHSCGESDIGDEELGKDPCFVILEDRPSLGGFLAVSDSGVDDDADLRDRNEPTAMSPPTLFESAMERHHRAGRVAWRWSVPLEDAAEIIGSVERAQSPNH